MNVQRTDQAAVEIEAEGIVVGCYAGGAFQESAARVDEALGGALSRLVENKDLEGKSGELTLLPAPRGIKAQAVVVAGLGEKEKLTPRTAFTAAASAAKNLAERRRRRAAFFLAEENEPGRVVEQGATEKIFSEPEDSRTFDYVTGQFG